MANMKIPHHPWKQDARATGSNSREWRRIHPIRTTGHVAQYKCSKLNKAKVCHSY